MLRAMPDHHRTSRKDTAWAVMAQNVGAVMLARAMHSEALQRERLNAVRHAGEQLVSGDKSTRRLLRS